MLFRSSGERRSADAHARTSRVCRAARHGHLLPGLHEQMVEGAAWRSAHGGAAREDGRTDHGLDRTAGQDFPRVERETKRTIVRVNAPVLLAR